ncbi:sulfocyanin [Deinococcus metalli]|uniref:Sulfocyanin n=1 Tax=Deinococcus metalli TaxID=1141878 RepID=A0A7W8NR87_9DEIO|nr:sulfocyanin-like copper-binding protein [Deinococcus metalli]MBB5378696.1 sulfocyanin [Deinococcus metalli]GHF61769.1 hypothetical protein GCM10017781_42430 [Deinococcus metalli]
MNFIPILLTAVLLGTAHAASPVQTKGSAVTIDLIAGQGSTNGGLNFNGGARGDRTFTVPLGATVTVKFKNMGIMPHSFVIRQGGAAPTDADASDAVFTSGYAPAKVEAGIRPGATTQVVFKASKAGSYYFVCGVPGHAMGGQYIRLVVSKAATVASFK